MILYCASVQVLVSSKHTAFPEIKARLHKREEARVADSLTDFCLINYSEEKHIDNKNIICLLKVLVVRGSANPFTPCDMKLNDYNKSSFYKGILFLFSLVSSGVALALFEVGLGLDLGQHLLPGALRADDVRAVLDEAFPHHGHLTDGAEEAAVVPGQFLEGHEFGVAKATLSCDDKAFP